jgi:HK97 family phage prohead protease
VTLADEVREYRIDFHLRDVERSGSGRYNWLEGRAVPYSVWGDVGWFLEMHAEGSFEQSTKAGTGKSLPLLLFHDNRSMPIGHSDSWRHDAAGMWGVWRLSDSAEAQTAARHADDGDLIGLSVGFQPIKSSPQYVDDWDPDLGPEHKDKITRLESRLLEVSLTPTPVFSDAGVTMVRTKFNIQQRAALNQPKRSAVDTWRDEVERLRSTVK